MPPAAGYQWVRIQGEWQQERLQRVQEPQRNQRSANRYEELQRYGPEEEEDDIDVSDRSGISLEDMLDQEFEGLPPPFTQLEEECIWLVERSSRARWGPVPERRKKIGKTRRKSFLYS